MGVHDLTHGEAAEAGAEGSERPEHLAKREHAAHGPPSITTSEPMSRAAMRDTASASESDAAILWMTAPFRLRMSRVTMRTSGKAML